MHNTVTAAEIKRRGLAAIEEGLRHGPVTLVKRNKPAAVVLSQDDYQRLAAGQPTQQPGLSAVQWLLSQPVAGMRSKGDIDTALAQERVW